MTEKEKLIQCISQLSDEHITTLLDAAKLLLNDTEPDLIRICPYCGSAEIIKFGHKRGKQRFFCKHCGRTFIPTTHTIMSNSHYPKNVWDAAISYTLGGDSISFAADNLGMSHNAMFQMRHKILTALQETEEFRTVCLGDVAELDETFVLDCYKGKPLDPSHGREARKHGAKAQKRGISNEYVCICTGVERKGSAYAQTLNRAKPSGEELKEIFEGHIADGTLAICDGLRSYNALHEIADCTIEDYNQKTKTEGNFYHLNTVNNFHSFIKERYDFYRGVATKYINRYNAMFALVYRNVSECAKRLSKLLLESGITNFYHSNRSICEDGLIVI